MTARALSAQSLKVRSDLAGAETRRRLFVRLCEQEGLPAPTCEHKFHSSRQWRIDFSWPLFKVALEVEGGAFASGGGGHTRGAAFVRNLDKYNSLACMGWRLLRVTPGQLCTAETIAMIRRCIRG